MVNLVEFEQLIDLQRMEHVGGKTFDFLLAVLSDSEIGYCLDGTKLNGFFEFFSRELYALARVKVWGIWTYLWKDAIKSKLSGFMIISSQVFPIEKFGKTFSSVSLNDTLAATLLAESQHIICKTFRCIIEILKIRVDCEKNW